MSEVHVGLSHDLLDTVADIALGGGSPVSGYSPTDHAYSSPWP